MANCKKPELCFRDGALQEGNKCKGNELLAYYTCLPSECRHSFHFSFKESGAVISFPFASEGSSGTSCIRVQEGKIGIHGPPYLKEVIIEVSGSLSRMRKVSTLKSLHAFYSSLISHYHRELATLDSIIENSIHKIVEGRLRAESLYGIYARAIKLHKGVHGLIYALRKTSNIYEGLEGLINDAVMLESMYSTSLDRITESFSLHYTITEEKTNSVVTKLTVISAIFLPLTLIAGIYGMNFKYMPELNNPLAYPLTLISMVTIVISELIYFRRKGWI